MMTDTIQHVLIMAAGRGNRMRPLTDIIPKAMMPYNGETLISKSLTMLRRYTSQIHVTVGYKSAMLSEHLMTIGNIASIFNTEGHSNSWWIYHTLMRFLDEPVVVLTCDNITELDMEFLNNEYQRLAAPACMVVPVNPLPMIAGDYINGDNHGFVTDIQRNIPTDIYCSGIQVVNPARILSLTSDEGDFNSVWRQLMAHKELKHSDVYPNKWFSVDTLEQLATLPGNET